jgi:hypothetical protein
VPDAGEDAGSSDAANDAADAAVADGGGGEAGVAQEAGPPLADGGDDAPSDAPAEGAIDAALSGDASDDADAAETGGIRAPPTTIDDAGGNPCGVSANGSVLTSVGGCTPSVLTSGGGTAVGSVVETDDAGKPVFDDAGVAVSTDASTSIVGGTQILVPSKYLCGTVPSGTTSLTINGLKDSYYYTVAVAAVDAVGNEGPLGVQCAQPMQIDDFLGAYYGAGGRAGGGYCSTEGAGAPAGTTGLAFLAAASLAALARKRSRARRGYAQR